MMPYAIIIPFLLLCAAALFGPMLWAEWACRSAKRKSFRESPLAKAANLAVKQVKAKQCKKGNHS